MSWQQSTTDAVQRQHRITQINRDRPVPVHLGNVHNIMSRGVVGSCAVQAAMVVMPVAGSMPKSMVF